MKYIESLLPYSKALLPYSKALVPAGVAVVLALLASVGVTPDMTVEDAVALLLTSLVVYLVPNKKVGEK